MFKDYKLIGFTFVVALLFMSAVANADFACKVDSIANDIPGQGDVTQLCYDFSSLPASYSASLSFDDVRFPGGNTGDGCLLFDTDDDAAGNIDYAICFQVGGNPASLLASSPFAYQCTSPNSDESCGGATLTALTATTCSSTTSSDDPFPSGDDHPSDTKVTCDVSTADIPAGGIQINACTYSSASPTSDPKDCIKDKDNGQVILSKEANGDTTTDFTFNSSSSSNSQNNTVTGEGLIFYELEPGTYTINELTPDNWATTSIECIDRMGVSVGTVDLTAGSISNLSVTKTERLRCTFVNSQEGDTSVTKSDGQVSYTPGAVSTYQIIVTNSGNSNLSGVEVEDTLPKGLTINSYSCSIPANCNLTSAGNTVSGVIDIPKSTSLTISIEVVASSDPVAYQ